ncbi:hypothetical protein D3C85_1190870 [compost metagenome]
MLGHPGARGRRQGVGGDPVAAQFSRLHQRQRSNTALGRRVVGLTDGALQTGAGAGVDDPRIDLCAALGLLTPVLHGVAGNAEVTLQVHRYHGVPVGFAEAGEHAIAADAGVVDHHVQVAERFDGLAHDQARRVIAGDVVAVGHGAAALAEDFADHGQRRFTIDVVDHYFCAFGGEGQRVGTAQTTAGTGDDHDAVFTDFHVLHPSNSSRVDTIPCRSEPARDGR